MKLQLITLLLILIPSITIPEMRLKNRLGKAEYCVISPKMIECTDHNMNECLRTAYLTPDAFGCLPIEETK
jgi:hypothetical protein